MEDRCIDRTELDSPTSAPNSPDPVLESYFRQQLEQLYADPSQPLPTNDETELLEPVETTVEQVQGKDEEEYDFRLFKRVSGPASVGARTEPQRITLGSSSPPGGESGFTSGGRSDKYYFTGDTGAELAEQYARAAVSGQDIIEGLKMRWVCCSVLESDIWA